MDIHTIIIINQKKVKKRKRYEEKQLPNFLLLNSESAKNRYLLNSTHFSKRATFHYQEIYD